MIQTRNRFIKLLPKVILIIALLGVPVFAQEPPPELEKFVYFTISRSSTRYHLEDCSSIKNSTVKRITIEEAIKYGFTPCNICKPED